MNETDRDQRDLSRFGYAQELFRTMGGFSNFAISFSIISILTGAVTLYGYGFAKGGPLEMALGWPIVAFFTLAVAASMAELASAFPTSGGMYHWSAALGGPGWGWFTAWFNIIGLVAALAGIDYGCALFAVPLLKLPPTLPVLLAIYALVLLSHALINQYGIRLVAWLNDASVVVHIVGVFLIVGALLLFAPKQPISFFFTTASSSPGQPYWQMFLLGLLQAQWTFTGFDGSAHTAEETVDPRRRAPWGMVLSVAVSAVVGYALLFALTLAVADPGAIVKAGASGDPVPVIILVSALGSAAGTAMSWLAVVAMWFCGLSTITSFSRTIFSFARDGGMPPWLRKVDRTHQTPVAAIWASAIAAFAGVGLAEMLSTGAYAVVTAISVVALYISYIAPVALAFRARHSLARGPWNLGAWSAAIQVVAMAWTLFICVILVMPPNQAAGQSLALVSAALAFFYFARGRQAYRGPAWAAHREA
ncbi:MAG: amino acid permease, partial [Terriglobales bacterium]